MSGHTHIHTYTVTQDNYSNRRCACTPRVNKYSDYWLDMTDFVHTTVKDPDFGIMEADTHNTSCAVENNNTDSLMAGHYETSKQLYFCLAKHRYFWSLKSCT